MWKISGCGFGFLWRTNHINNKITTPEIQSMISMKFIESSNAFFEVESCSSTISLVFAVVLSTYFD